jgi:protein gp37
VGEHSKIEWTEATWNPIRGCSRVSEGCRNCYAERIAARFGGPVEHQDKSDFPFYEIAEMTDAGPRWTGKVELVESALYLPLRWKKPRRIFVNSMSDLFHEKIPTEWINTIFGVMHAAPWHIYQILTKRAELMRAWAFPNTGLAQMKNIWLGVSVENQKTADERIPLLLQTPAAVRWVSYEPALGPVDFTDIMGQNYLKEFETPADIKIPRALDWLVAGGESGPGARPAHPGWFRAVRDQCAAAGVPFFFKQWGEWAPVREAKFHDICGSVGFERVGKKKAGRLLDGREHNEYPATRK